MRNRSLLFLAALEGSTVVCVELLGTKLLSPVLGSSVYVWSFILAATLAALAAGYYIGGFISTRKEAVPLIPQLLLAASVFIVLMPFLSTRIFYYFGDLTFFPLLFLQTIAVLFIPLFLLGIISPLVVHALAGVFRSSPSLVFSLSTAAGIFAGLFMSFFLVPVSGVNNAVLIWSALIAVSTFFFLPGSKRSYLLFFVLIAGISVYAAREEDKAQVGNQLFHKNGILGDIRVVEFDPYDTSISKTTSRWLFVNNISQTMYDKGAKEKYFTYAYRIRATLDSLPAGSKVLLCGLGGGSIVSILSDKKFEVDVCELDERIPVLAKKYFDLPSDQQVSIDDARHFIRTAKKKYNAVILDIFRGEETPNHVLSREGLSDLKKIMNENSFLIINSHGYLKGKRGDGNRAIFKTLEASGFNVSAEYTADKEEQSNILYTCNQRSIIKLPTEIPATEFNGGEVLTDKRPRLEKLNRQAALTWRIEAKKLLLSEMRAARNQ